jgi:hypothetical protein
MKKSLSNAIKIGDLNQIKAILPILPQVDIKKYNKLLLQSIGHGHLEVVKHFVSIGLDPKTEEKSLLLAIEAGDMDMVKYLVSIGCGDNGNDKAMRACVRSGHADIYNYLIQQRFICKNNNAYLKISAQKGCLEMFKYLMHTTPPDQKTIAYLFNKSIEQNQQEIIKHLLDTRCSHFNIYMLNDCIAEGYVEIIKYLVQINYPFDHHNALMISIMHGHLEIVKYFVELHNIFEQKQGTNLRFRHSDIFKQSVGGGNLEITKYLLDMGYDPSHNYDMFSSIVNCDDPMFYTQMLYILSRQPNKGLYKFPKIISVPGKICVDFFPGKDAFEIIIRERILSMGNLHKQCFLKKILRPVSMHIQLNFI